MLNPAVEFGALVTRGPVPVSGGSQIGPPVTDNTTLALIGFSDLDRFYFGGCNPGEFTQSSRWAAVWARLAFCIRASLSGPGPSRNAFSVVSWANLARRSFRETVCSNWRRCITQPRATLHYDFIPSYRDVGPVPDSGTKSVLEPIKGGFAVHGRRTTGGTELGSPAGELRRGRPLRRPLLELGLKLSYSRIAPRPRYAVLSDFSDQIVWLRHHVVRLRLALRFTRARQTEIILQEAIGEAEMRLEALEERQLKNPNRPLADSP